MLATVLVSLYTLRQYRRCNDNVLTPTMLRNHERSATSLLLIGLLMILFVLIQISVAVVLHIKLRKATLLSGETFHNTKIIADIMLLIAPINTVTNSIVIISRSRRLKRHLFKCCFKLFLFSFFY